MAPNTKSLAAFVQLTRPHFLLGGFLMFGLGAFSSAPIEVGKYILGQSIVTCAQLTAHYVNEYADFVADRAVQHRTLFSGGSGVLGEGALPRMVALKAAFLTSTATLVLATVIAMMGEPLAAGLGLVGLAVSWAYSMPPLRLLNTGAGEVVTALTVAIAVPLTGALLASGPVPHQLWWLLAVLTLLQLAMLLAFELPDRETDAVVGKRVLAVRLGVRKTLTLILVLIVLAALAITTGWARGDIATAIAAGSCAALPFAVALIVAAPRLRFGITTLSAVSAFAFCAAGMLTGLIVSS